MPYISPFYTEFFHEPLTEDVEELLSRFQQTDSVRYGVFSAIWRDMKFSDVFLGIKVTCSFEMKRLCTIALATAVKYFLPPYSYQIRVGGLYLMFALYHAQLGPTPAKIRLALKDWSHVQMFLTESEEAEHHDVVYIFHQLVASGAIHYTAMPHCLAFHRQQSPKAEGLSAEFLSRAVALHELQSAGILEEMAGIQCLYDDLKEATVEVRHKVNMTNPDLNSCLSRCVSEFSAWQRTASPKEKNAEGHERLLRTTEDDCSSRARLLSSIKQKSYSTVQGVTRRCIKVEPVDYSSSGGEQFRSSSGRKKYVSLRARTWKNLGKKDEKESNAKAWLLSAPAEQDGYILKRLSQTAPFREVKKEAAG
ncbi:snRNA-activating protein complex subunit 1-like [Fundulus diaphanus]